LLSEPTGRGETLVILNVSRYDDDIYQSTTTTTHTTTTTTTTSYVVNDIERESL